MKKQIYNYYFFLFLSTFSRGLIEVFSLVLLYKKGFPISTLLFFLLLTYLLGIIVCFISIKLNKKIILILSNIIYGLCFLYLSKIERNYFSLFLLAIFLSFSNYSSHTIRRNNRKIVVFKIISISSI